MLWNKGLLLHIQSKIVEYYFFLFTKARMAVIINPNIPIGDITHTPNIVIAYLVLLMAESFLTTLSTHRVNKKPKEYIISNVKYIIKLLPKTYYTDKGIVRAKKYSTIVFLHQRYQKSGGIKYSFLKSLVL